MAALLTLSTLSPLYSLAALWQDGIGDIPDAGEAPPPMWPLWIGMVGIMWFVLIRPERKERKRKEALISAIKKNDRVITSSGMYATVAAVNDGDVTVKFDDGPTRVRMLKSAIATVINAESKNGDKQD
jgi:preprotein translocase subunit YajC